MHVPDIHVSSDPALLDVALIHRFLSEESSWAKGISLAAVQTSITHSLCFGLYQDGAQIGFARMITDYATFAYLCDVFVLPAQRGKGYSRLLMQHVMADARMQRLRRIVLVTSNAHGLYRKVGFDAVAKPQSYMELHRPDVYLQSDADD